MTFDFRGKTAAEMQAASAISNRDENVRYYAGYGAEVAQMVTALVPIENRQITDDWLKRIVTMHGIKEVKPFHMIDPLLILESDDMALPLTGEFPGAPEFAHCARCQSLEAAAMRNGFGDYPTRRVLPARFSCGPRVIELLLCRDCIDFLQVVPS